MFHRSDRLLLRPIWPEDWQGVLAGISDEGVVRNLARAPWPYVAEDARKFVSLPIDPKYPRFLITRARDAEVVGCIGIDPLEDRTDAVELGYWIARPFWGQGFATEAGAAVLNIVPTLGHETVVASHFLDNPASGIVLRKLGFEPTGRVVERHSCARGEKAPTAEYEISLTERDVVQPVMAEWRAA
ncbi:GNAT family N-acetyltransferase [Erythrobacter rubeus]|uniref:GNAT family N-acetyltransferase n=1 Tax=Erythrobacter rubeus TaxID=2760803 RepID=A0ABR8KNP8_9SPHN|nr:GNAT family N-acetyltransferase [Erythrobacter rubeus]MBD2842286.1 GNAT family N-acetyltransferase [Erythrobacter rubeus]